mmetsp:Transcript_22088/g.55691  ORF Transcript_22088/g.55691 Transcript_22088/m.55691 type:complete len:325 (-) Transcript_22088:1969-2943(-)
MFHPLWSMHQQAAAAAAYSVDDPGLSVDPNFTTVMLRNIPNKYTTKMLLAVLDRRFAKQYDYVYLPVDFVNHCNVGYAFINLRSAEIRARFYRHFHNQKVKEVLPGFNSKKVLKQVCEVNKAKVQGAKENIRRIRQMSMLMQRLKDHPDWVPLLFDHQGTAIPLDLDAPVEKREPMRPKRSPMSNVAPSWDQMYPGSYASPHCLASPMFGSPMDTMDMYKGYMLQQQAQVAYNVAVASATAAAVSAASSPTDYSTDYSTPSPTDWYGNKENMTGSGSTAGSWGPQPLPMQHHSQQPNRISWGQAPNKMLGYDQDEGQYSGYQYQ